MEPIGQNALRLELGLRVPPPHVQSFIAPGMRRREVADEKTIEYYPRSYEGDGSIISHLRFALRYEPLDPAVLASALAKIGKERLEAWVRDEPTGSYSRRAWFFFELFTEQKLDLPDAKFGNYVYALDPEKHITSSRLNSPRHRVIDNLLGGQGLCPFVRRTAKLQHLQDSNISQQARDLTESYDPLTLARAVSYLYTKETRSTFELEGESPSAARADRFVAALRSAPKFQATDKVALIQLQGDIVDPRYAAKDWRDFQNFVGETVGGYREKVHFICPRPEDVAELMQAWFNLVRRVNDHDVDPVVAAALVAFSFVFIHPFEDGNGRIHRFLIHHILAQRDFSPPGIIFPVSASILRERHRYDNALESFSTPIGAFIEWHFDENRNLIVENETAYIYRYFDATKIVEYLYDRVIDTVQKDLREELGYVAIYDRALIGVREVVDMPDRKASLFVRFVMQNGGRLSKGKKALFEEISEAELLRMEDAVRTAMEELAPEPLHRAAPDTQ